MRSQVVSQDQSDQRINTGNMSSSHILVTGPHTVGKTSLIHTFITGNFQHVSDEREKYCSSIHLNLDTSVFDGKSTVNLNSLSATAGERK